MALADSSVIHRSGAVGLFDSGLGGLTVLREVQRRFPGERIIYLGDTARTPYGSKGRETIVRYARECARFLLRHEMKLLIVACNTVSALALDVLHEEIPCPVIGTIEPSVREATRNGSVRRIGVIGTESTVASGVYQRSLAGVAPDSPVTACACPLFVPLVEHGFFEGKIVDAAIEHYCGPMRDGGIDTLILGCTHYPILRDSLARFFGPQVELVECSRAIAEDVGRLLGPPAAAPGTRGERRYFVTDSVSPFDRLARIFLGDETAQVQRVDL